MAEIPPVGPPHPPRAPGPAVLNFVDEDESGAGTRKRRHRILLVASISVAAVAFAFGAMKFRSSDAGAVPDNAVMFTLPRNGPSGESLADATVPPAEVNPASVEAPVGTTVELALLFTDGTGTALPDTLTRFTIESGSGTLVVDTARTDSVGVARARVRLPSSPEVMVVNAQMVGTELPPVSVRVLARLAQPERIVAVSGDGQEALTRSLLSQRPAVRVTDTSGNPVPGVEVVFQVEAGGGAVSPTRIRTDLRGVASTSWRMGATAGTQRVIASVVGAPVPPVTLTATALVSAPTAAAEGPTPRGLPGASTPEPEPEAVPVAVVRRSFAVGGSFVCGISGGRAACRGANDRGQGSGGGSGDFLGLAAGVSHACALDGTGTAWCWGANDGGQLGTPERMDRSVPVRVETDLAFSTLTAGAGHTCGLAGDGKAACWGQNLNGQLGTGSRDDSATPRLLSRAPSFQMLVAGWNHTCGLSANGALSCWGANGQGQLGDGTRLDRLAPARVRGSFRSVVAGSRHTCGISGDRVLCWGDNSFGQLGDGSTQTRTRPTPVEALPARPTRVVAGAVHTCALVLGGAVYCWGQNAHGRLGDGSAQNRSTPTVVAGGITFSRLYAGGAVTCGFSADGGQYCWGLNQSGQLGDGTRDNRASPTRVGG